MEDRPDGLADAVDAVDAGPGGDASAVAALRGVALAGRDGRFDVELRGALIAGIRPAAERGDARWLALPAFVTFHAHADRAFAAPSARPASFAEAVSAAKAARSFDDALARRPGGRVVIKAGRRIRTPSTG